MRGHPALDRDGGAGLAEQALGPQPVEAPREKIAQRQQVGVTPGGQPEPRPHLGLGAGERTALSLDLLEAGGGRQRQRRQFDRLEPGQIDRLEERRPIGTQMHDDRTALARVLVDTEFDAARGGESLPETGQVRAADAARGECDRAGRLEPVERGVESAPGQQEPPLLLETAGADAQLVDARSGLVHPGEKRLHVHAALQREQPLPGVPRPRGGQPPAQPEPRHQRPELSQGLVEAAQPRLQVPHRGRRGDAGRQQRRGRQFERAEPLQLGEDLVPDGPVRHQVRLLEVLDAHGTLPTGRARASRAGPRAARRGS